MEKEKTLFELWKKSAATYVYLPAIRWLEKGEVKERSYRELDGDIVNVRKGLVKLGFEGKHIAILGVSSASWVTAYFGIITCKNTAVPLDAALAQSDIIDLLNRSDTEALFIDPKFASLVEPIKQNCPKVRKLWTLAEEAIEGTETIAELMAAGADAEEPAAPAEDDVAMIIYTSGTTGKSKGVMLRQRSLFDNVEAIGIDPLPGIVFMSTLPVHHAYCLVMDWLQGFHIGATLCINDSLLHMVKNLSVFKPHVMLMVPLMIETIYKRLRSVASKMTPEEVHTKVFGGRLERIYTGGAHLEPYYIEEFNKYGVIVLEGYGMSECSPVISTNNMFEYKAGSVGKPLPNAEIKFEDGEILVRGSSVMAGYYKMDKETSETLRDGWLHTGDKGYLDEDGFLFINGRVKNLIILSNGENISPEEIESSVSLNELICEMIVAGENNLLKAYIYPEQAFIEGKSDDEVKALLREVIDGYNKEQPTYRQISSIVVRKNPFIKTSTRKILRDKVDIDEPTA